ncbi:MAG: DedA family protein [Candidatus Kerfeldbacteria bacterium]|nr:DedA family protein [Candidatus Kerfeldbacteria bacterium]
MSFVQRILDLFLHLDDKLASTIAAYGEWTYAILFVIIFCETGLVITPFLPGDSLIFAAGAFAAQGSLNVLTVFVLLFVAAVVGDSVNYWIGHKIGERIFTKRSRVLKKEYLDRTHRFYEKYGGATIILARFVPIVRTIAPFVAGVGTMTYRRFFAFNILGGLLWVSLFTFGGFFFGTLPFVQRNFEWVIIVIVLVSLLPPVIEATRHQRRRTALSEPPTSGILPPS